jgi:hypothetical protein
MSAVKAKNAVVKAIKAEIGKSIPAGVEVSASAKDGKLWLYIEAAPFDVHAEGVIKLTPHGFTQLMSLMGDDGYTPECRAVVTKMKEIGEATIKALGYSGRPGVLVNRATHQQVARMRAAQQQAA